MRTLRNLFDRILGTVGYRLIAEGDLKRLLDLESFAKSGTGLSHHLREAIAIHQVDCVFDVGANEGQFHTFLREEVGYPGWIISFEPLPDLATDLQDRAKADPFWNVIPLALSSRAEDRVLRRTSESVFSSFHSASPEQPDKYESFNETVESVPVTTSAVDAIWPDLKKEIGVSRLLLKMDTQGHDLEVFSGAECSLSDIPVLLTELSFAPIYEDAPGYREVLSTFETAGFLPSAFSPVSFDKDGSAIEMDGLFVRKRG